MWIVWSFKKNEIVIVRKEHLSNKTKTNDHIHLAFSEWKILEKLKVQRFIGVWEQRHLQYLKECRKAVYLNLLTSGRLNSYLADINEQAEDMFFRPVKKYTDS